MKLSVVWLIALAMAMPACVEAPEDGLEDDDIGQSVHALGIEFHLQNRATSKCADIPFGAPVSGYPLNQRPCYQSDPQTFTFTYTYSYGEGIYYYSFINSSGMCLVREWDSAKQRYVPRQRACNANDSKQKFAIEYWEYVGDFWYRIRSKDTNQCLDVPSSNPGNTYLQFYSCHTGLNQRWRLWRRGDPE